IAGIVTAILITLAVYLVIALGLIASQRPETPVASGEPIDFDAAITAGYDDLPAHSTFAARDESKLNYRLYGDPAAAQRIVLLLHGSGWHGMQFHSMARHIAESSASIVAVPDLRGHGPAPTRRGDLDHIGQFEEDLADLIGHLAQL